MISYALDRGEITPRLVLQTIIPHKGRRLYFYRLDAHHGLLAPEVVGGTARGDTHLFLQIVGLAALAIGRTRDRFTHGLEHGGRNDLHMEHRIGGQPPPPVENERDPDETRIAEQAPGARKALILMQQQAS